MLKQEKNIKKELFLLLIIAIINVTTLVVTEIRTSEDRFYNSACYQYNPIRTEAIELYKVTADAAITDNNECYSLEHAQYKILNDDTDKLIHEFIESLENAEKYILAQLQFCYTLYKLILQIKQLRSQLLKMKHNKSKIRNIFHILRISIKVILITYKILKYVIKKLLK